MTIVLLPPIERFRLFLRIRHHSNEGMAGNTDTHLCRRIYPPSVFQRENLWTPTNALSRLARVNSRESAPFGPLPGPVVRSISATLERVIAALRPHEGIYDVDVDGRVLATMQRYVPYMAGPIRLGFPFGLLVIEFGPPFFGFGFTRFRSMPRPVAIDYLQRMGNGAAPFRMLFDGLRVLVLVAFYQQPEIMAALGVEWESRSRELIKRRGKLMAMDAALANPRNAGGGPSGGPST